MGGNHDLFSDYAQAKGRAAGCWPDDGNGCVVTISRAIEAMNVGGSTNSTAGVAVNCDNKTAPTCSTQSAGIAAAVRGREPAFFLVAIVSLSTRSFSKTGSGQT
jgi:hypothetical protein